MPTALAISPHLDDAVFSAGGALTRLARDGWRVVVATVFAASVADPQGFALACQLDKGLAPEVDYMALRRREDSAACAIIGAEPRWLPFVEAPHRGYRSATDLFAGLHDDDAAVEAIATALSDLIGELSPNAIFSPQAIGAHVDHEAVYLALCPCDLPRWLWADFPYFARSSAGESRFAGEFRCRPQRHIELSREELDAKKSAALAYATQVDFQFGGPDMAQAAIANMGRVERYAADCEWPA